MSSFPLPDYIHNWVVEYLDQRKHCTRYGDEISTMQEINASIVQGSGFGPSAFVFNASDLHPLNEGNHMYKYADDIYLVVPARNSMTIPAEIARIGEWAEVNNLKLNVLKSLEMIVRHPRARKGDIPDPPTQPDILRVDHVVVLGVILQSNLKFDKHIEKVVNRAAQSFYALRLLRAHGLSGVSLWDVTRSTMLSQMLYASEVWWGFADQAGRSRLQAVINRAVRQGYLPPDQKPFDLCCASADDNLFKTILHNKNHVLHGLLPPVKETRYNLRSRAHNRILPQENDTLLRKNFIYCMLYKDIY